MKYTWDQEFKEEGYQNDKLYNVFQSVLMQHDVCLLLDEVESIFIFPSMSRDEVASGVEECGIFKHNHLSALLPVFH